MDCLIKRNQDGAIETVLTANGQESVLFKELLKHHSGNAEQALRSYAVSFTPSFKEQHQSQAEPSLTTLAEFIDRTSSLLMPGVAPSSTPSGGVTKLIQLKENLLDYANARLSDVRAELKQAKTDEARFSALSKEKAELIDYISGEKGLEQEITKLKALDSKSPEVIGPFIQKELDRLDKLIQGNVENTKEAADIVRFIKAVADLRLTSQDNKDYGHPLFEEAELFDGDVFIVTPEVEKIYKKWGEAANIIDGKLLARDRVLTTEIINENENVGKIYGDLTFKQITLEGVGLKDTNWVDMMVMDIGTGIWSHNGIIPQVAKMIINEEFEKQEAWAKGINEKLDHILPRVRKALEGMGQTIGIPGIRSVSFDMFRQTDQHGNYKPNIVSKFSFEWQDSYEDMQRAFDDLKKAAREAETPADTQRKYKKAFDYRNKWLKNNAKIVNPALVPELALDPELAQFSAAFGTAEAQAAHAAELKELVGEKYYQKVVADQKTKIREYLVLRKQRVEEMLAGEGKTLETDLSREAKFNIALWDNEHNPFAGAIYSEQDRPFDMGTVVKAHNWYSHNIHLPLKTRESGRETGFYDKSYAKIEENADLSEFYDIIFEATSGIWDRLDHEAQKKVSTTSILGMERSMLDLFLDKDIRFYQAMSIAFRRMIDFMKGSFGVKKQDAFSFAKINTITGKAEYGINDEFIQRNTGKINNLFKVKSLLFKSEFNRKSTVSMERFTKFSIVKVNSTNEAWLTELVSRYTHVPASEVMSTYAEYQEDSTGTPYAILRVGKIMQAHVMHEVAKDMSFDLPKVIKNYANLAAQYSARKAVLPTMELLKGHYEDIKSQATNNADEAIQNGRNEGKNRLNSLRVNAIRQYDNWFNRVVLGNYGLRKNMGFVNTAGLDETKPEAEPTPEDETGKIAWFLRGLNKLDRQWSGGRWDGKIYSSEEQEMIDDVNKALKDLIEQKRILQDALVGASEGKAKTVVKQIDEINRNIKSLEDIKAKTGKDFALSGVFDAMMSFIRWRGLGFNINSGLKNVVEGQIANSIIATRGQYFPPENIHEISLPEMIYGDGLPKAKMPQNAALIKTLMTNYNVLQDASNELQKSSAQSRFAGLSRLNPFYILKKGEYYNQAPLLAAVLKDTPITSREGVVSNVKDAMIAVYDTQGKRWTAKLREEFRTDENIASWEHANGKDYFAFKSKMKNVISNTHGDFDALSGMMAKSTHVGQATTMFKTWLPRMIHQRFGITQDNLISGVKGEKGFYRSHTPISAMIHAGIIGTTAFGPLGGAIAGVGGLILGGIYGAKSNLGVISETIMIAKMLFRKAIGIPLNPISRAIRGKPFLNDDRAKEFEKMKGKNFNEIDYGNFKACMQDLALNFVFLSLLLMTKAMLWDDDDEKDSPRRQAHNLLANEFMGFANSASMYASPTGMVTTVTNLAVIRLLADMGKSLGTLQGLVEHTDQIVDGPNRGGSKFLLQQKKTFMPSLFHPELGFEKLQERQFVPSVFDHYFWGEEKEAKNEIKLRKMIREQQLMEEFPDMDEDKFKKKLNKDFGRKKKKESYKEFLERIKAKEKAREEAEEASE